MEGKKEGKYTAMRISHFNVVKVMRKKIQESRVIHNS